MTLDQTRRGHLFSFWLASLCVFPYPLLARGIRSKPDRCVVLIVAGAGLIGAHLYMERAFGYSVAWICFGLQMALAGAWQIQFVKRDPQARTPVRSLLLGGASLAFGIAWVLLPR